MYVPMRSFPVSCIRNASVKRPRGGGETLPYRVHLPQHRPLGEEQRLLGVHDDQVEEGAPGVALEEKKNQGRAPSRRTGGKIKALTLLFSSRYFMMALRGERETAVISRCVQATEGWTLTSV